MKTKILLTSLFLAPLIIAQPILMVDSIVVKTSNDTLYIWDYNAWEQCGFQLDYNIEITDSVITITQTDTADDLTTCYGYHNFLVPIVNLPENKYRIDIFRDCLFEEIKFIKSIMFEYDWKQKISFLPDSIYLAPQFENDSISIINNADEAIYLDSISNKYPASYYCAIKRGNEYLVPFFVVSTYHESDSLKILLEPNDTINFFIVGVDACPICKSKYYEYLKDTLIFSFSSDSNESTNKLLLLDSKISLNVENEDIKDPSFYLSQNFPNPFNPGTKINYYIPERSFVSLKVYDLLGNEIETLINEEKDSGNYEIEFNGSNFSSGVYFYRIQAGNFSDTKKFLLLK